MLDRKIAKYLRSRAITSPWQLDGNRRSNFRAAVVIPVLAEKQSLPHTLDSLRRNPPEALDQILVVIVVNNRATADEAEKEENRTLLVQLEENTLSDLNLAWVDACSAGRELPEHEGVGLARRIGCDLALSRLDWSIAPLLISLDADTLVEADYLPAIFAHFAQNAAGGAFLPFRHQRALAPGQEEAIRDYELYLRSYCFGLQWAASPYAFTALGSALACRARSYVAAGGMPRRTAGEDFYLLQQLVKIGGISALKGTCVRPSPRFSARVPFGTGRAVQARVDNREGEYRFVSLASFDILRQWLQLVGAHSTAPATRILALATELSRELGDFVTELGFARCWERLQRNNSPARFLAAWHNWFDGLRTRQLLHRLEAKRAPAKPEMLIEELLAAGGWENRSDRQSQLALLEQLQGVTAGEGEGL